MTKQETKKAEALLKNRVQRTEICGADTEGGFCLTAYWHNGGQKLFYTIDEVREHIAERERADG